MEKRKQDIPSNQPHHHKQPPPPSSSPTNQPPDSPVMWSYSRMLAKLYVRLCTLSADAASHLEEIKQTIKNGLVAECLGIMERLFEQYSAPADFYRIKSEWCAEMAQFGDEEHKQKWMNICIASAKRSVQLGPNDIENHFVLLSWISQFAQSPQLVIQKCKVALQIDQSNDKDYPHCSTRSKIINLLREKEKQERIETGWKSMTLCRYIPVPFAELEAHLQSYSLTDQLAKEAIDVVRNAWNLNKSHPSWKFWQCFCSEEKFHTSDVFLKHFADTHLTSRARSIILTGTLVHGNPSTRFETGELSNQERIFADGGSSSLLVSPSCVLDFGIDASASTFPPVNPSITPFSYKSKLNEWNSMRLLRKRQGRELSQFLNRLNRKKEEKSDDSHATMSTEEALERLSADIDSEIETKGEWISPTGGRTEMQRITKNPFGEYDYRNVLLPLVQSYIVANVLMGANREAQEISDAREKRSRTEAGSQSIESQENLSNNKRKEGE